MWKLSHADQLNGESGYFLTVFESAIDFIINYDINENIEYENRNKNNSNDKPNINYRTSLMNNFSLNSQSVRFSFDNDS